MSSEANVVNTSADPTIQPPSLMSVDIHDLEALAWILGGPRRVVELWFAHLWTNGLLKREKGSFVVTNLSGEAEENQSVVSSEKTAKLAGLSLHEKQAWDRLPHSDTLNSLYIACRPSLRRLQKQFIQSGILVTPSKSRHMLLRLFVSSLVFVHMVVLFILAMPALHIILSALVWLVAYPFFFRGLDLPVHPFESLRADLFLGHNTKEVEEFLAMLRLSDRSSDELLSESDIPMKMCTTVALLGSASLLETPFDDVVLPQSGVFFFS